VGGAREGWTWIYNPWFRITQLLAALTVLAEDVFRFPCELNVLEALSVSAVRPQSELSRQPIPCRNFRRRPSSPSPTEEEEKYAEEHDYDRASQSRSSSERRAKTSARDFVDVRFGCSF